MEHQGTKTIETERLILRKFTADDLSAIFHNWTSDEKVTEFLRWPTHKSIDITKRVLESWLLEYEKPDFYQCSHYSKRNRRTYRYHFCN